MLTVLVNLLALLFRRSISSGRMLISQYSKDIRNLEDLKNILSQIDWRFNKMVERAHPEIPSFKTGWTFRLRPVGRSA